LLGGVKPKDFHEVPPRVEYSLTELGVSLKTVLEPLCAWGEQHMAKIKAARSKKLVSAK